MIRITLLTLFTLYFSAIAWRDWYKSLCALIFLTAFFQHPDMPKELLGISGINHWNFLLINVFFSWLLHRRSEKNNWDMPREITIILIIYLIVIVASFIRMSSDMSGIIEYYELMGAPMPSNKAYFNDDVLNSIKWVIPGLLLFDGCHSRKRFLMALYTIVSVYFFLAIQFINYMPLTAIASLSGDKLQAIALKVASKTVGYSRVNLSMMLGGGAWAILVLRELAEKPSIKFAYLFGAIIVMYGQALTGGRMGYITWFILGLMFCLLRWRRYLLFIPVIVIVVALALPSVKERVLMGIPGSGSEKSFEIENNQLNTYMMTSGRTNAWPLVIEGIKQEPWIGYGREAMKNIGISQQMIELYGINESFPHPHNAYLQILLDNGIIGFVPIMIFYFLIIKYEISLFMEKKNKYCIIAGGVSLSLTMALLLAAMGSQSFYPVVGSVGMWCSIGLMLRVYVQRSSTSVTDVNPEDFWNQGKIQNQ